MTGQRARLGSDTLLQTAIAEEDVGLVVNQVEAVLVVHGTHVGLANGQTDRVGDTLAQGTRGDFNTVRDAHLGVTRGDRVNLPKVLQVVHRHLVAGQVEHNVLQRTGVAVGKDETVTVDPLGVGGGEAEELGPEDVRDGGHAHGRARVARVGLGDDVGREGANGATR